MRCAVTPNQEALASSISADANKIPACKPKTVHVRLGTIELVVLASTSNHHKGEFAGHTLAVQERDAGAKPVKAIEMVLYTPGPGHFNQIFTSKLGNCCWLW